MFFSVLFSCCIDVLVQIYIPLSICLYLSYLHVCLYVYISIYVYVWLLGHKQDPKEHDACELEVKLLRSLEHPNIVAYEYIYIIFLYLEYSIFSYSILDIYICICTYE